MAQAFYADLSFTNRPDPESELILWSVSPTGMYARDCHAGSLYAFEALEFLLNDPTDMGYLLSGVALAMIRRVTEPSGIEVGFWGTIQKFAVAGARHQGTEKHRAQVQNSYADYKRWLAEEMGGAWPTPCPQTGGRKKWSARTSLRATANWARSTES